MQIFETKIVINSIYADFHVLDCSTKSSVDTVRDKYYLCRAARQIKISDKTQATAMVHGQGTGLLTNETHCEIMGSWCSVNTWGSMEILLGKPICVYFAILMAYPENLPIIMILATASGATIWMVPAQEDELPNSGCKAGEFHTPWRKQRRIFHLKPFTITRWSATMYKFIDTNLWIFQKRFQVEIWKSNSPPQTRIQRIATRLYPCSDSLRAYQMSILVLSKLCSTV